MPKLKAKDIPGYLEAVSRETELRDIAFLGTTEMIGGIGAQSMNLQHFDALQVLRSPFFKLRFDLSDDEILKAWQHGAIRGSDICIFLWNVSPTFRQLNSVWDEFVYWRFVRSIRKHDALTLVRGILNYVQETFMDAPSSGKNSAGVPHASLSAMVIDRMVSRGYAWHPDVILDMPLKQIFQLLRCIQKRDNPDAVFGGLSATAMERFAARLNVKN